MDKLVGVLRQETDLVRGGRLAQAAALAQPKADLTSLYIAAALRLRASQTHLSRIIPDRLRGAAAPSRHLPDAAPDQSDGARHRACGVGRHRPRGSGQDGPPGSAADLRRIRPRQPAGPAAPPARWRSAGRCKAPRSADVNWNGECWPSRVIRCRSLQLSVSTGCRSHPSTLRRAPGPTGSRPCGVPRSSSLPSAMPSRPPRPTRRREW